MADIEPLPLPGQNVIEIVLPNYLMKPAENEKFYPSEARTLAEKIIAEEFQGKEFDEDDAKEWSLVIADRIKTGVRALKIPRYKVVVQVTVGQMKDQGVRVASRCLWDTATDNYASVSFTNDTIWCSAMIFGIFAE